MRNMRLTAILVLLGLVIGVSLASSQEAGSRSGCEQKGKATLANLEKWIEEYEGKMQNAEPVQKAKFEEWIRELKKLKKLVEQSLEKLVDENKCASDDCVADQCNLIEIADQQILRLLKESKAEGEGDDTGTTEQQSGRSVMTDENTLGDDTIVDSQDTEDAADTNYADKSDSSDNQSQGNDNELEGVTDKTGTDDTAPPRPPEATEQ